MRHDTKTQEKETLRNTEKLKTTYLCIKSITCLAITNANDRT
jgi:hypothetical protein